MLEKTLNKVFSSRIFYIFFALLVSIALWLYVQYTENQDRTWDVANIQVVYKNADVLRDKGLLISSMDPETVAISFEASRSAGSRLMARGAVTVEIDLANISTTGAKPLQYEIIYPAGIDSSSVRVLSRSVAAISLLVDRLRDVAIPVQVSYKGGTASDDLIVETEEYSPRTITVEGPEDIISRISHAFVPIPRENLSATFTDDLGFVLIDKNGDEIDESVTDSLLFSHDTIRVTVPIRLVKKVPLYIELMHGAGTSDANTMVTYIPPFITVSGDPESIRDFNNILLGTIDTTRFTETTTEAFPILLPNNFTNISGESEAHVLVEVVGLAIAYYSTPNLQYVNVRPGFTATITTQTLDVRIRGPKEDLDNLDSLTNIRVVADLRDYDPGTYFVPARVFIDGIDADIGAVGERYRITVTIEKE